MPFEDLAGDGQADQGRDLSTIFAQPLQEGGCPCGAHVLPTASEKERPNSSSNTMSAPSRRDFFYPGPIFFHPGFHQFSVLLGCTWQRFLNTIAQFIQHALERIWMVADAKFLFDQFGHTHQCPAVGRVPTCHRTSIQQSLQSLLMLGSQFRLPT